MIKRFNIDALAIEEDELLSYVYTVAQEYCPDVDVNEDGEVNVCSPNSSLYIFKMRYNECNLSVNFNYDDYVKNKSVCEALSGMGIDLEKFWYLLLFIADYSKGICVEGLERKGTPSQQLTLLTETINDNIESVDCFLKVTCRKPIVLTLKIEGEHEIVIDNPETLYYLSHFCSSELHKYRKQRFDTIIGGSLNGNQIDVNTKPESNSVHVWYFTKMFQTFFELISYKRVRAKKGTAISYNKLLLISRLVYFTNLLNNENLMISDDTIKGFLKQYKGHELNRINNIYW